MFSKNFSKRISRVGASVFGVLFAFQASAFSSFTVSKIQFSGLNRVDPASLSQEVLVKPGQVLTESDSNKLIQSLYQTGYFQNVSLLNQNNILVIQVQERQAISKVDITGNKEITTDILKNVLTQAGFTAGNLFDPSALQNVIQSLQQAYYDKGKYAVQVSSQITNLSNNRVEINLVISEGLYAKIRHINFVGNHAFSDSTLRGELKLSTPGILTIFNHQDRYTPDGMNESIQQLSDYYMDQGYLNFHVNGSQVSLSPDKKLIYLNFDVTEGNIYHFSGDEILGDLILPLSQMQSFVGFKSGDVFSKSKVMDAAKAMQSALADQGYAFAHVNPMPVIDEKKRTVKMTFYVDPGKIQYIRHLEFVGNNTANDKVLRQRMELQEQSRYSQQKIADSKRRIQRQPYIESVDDQITPVIGTDDMIDENFHIKEMNANKAGMTFGYSQLDKLILGGYLTMPDLFGTGNIFGTNLQLSKPAQSLSFSFDQPYFTQDGIEQSINLYLSRVDYADRNLANYTTNSMGANLGYSIPLGEDNYFNIGFGYDNTHLMQGSDETSSTISSFVNQYGSVYNSYILSTGLTRDTTNNAYFPTAGIFENATLKAAVPGSSLKWYQLLTRVDWYHQIFGPWYTFGGHGKVDYGGGYGGLDRLPFFENFYSGGWGTVRGYGPSSMGPSDLLTCNPNATSCVPGTTSEGNPLGGNLLVAGSLNFYFPIPFFKPSQSYRMGVFVDGGNVYNTQTLTTGWNSAGLPRFPNFSNLRYSAGVSLEWQIPMIGLVGLSLAKDLNSQPGDDTRIFNFTIGQTF
jgi:outer membrane protein insertion porin family